VTTYQDPSPASDAPWTDAEEAMIAASVRSLDDLQIGRLEALHEAYRPTGVAGRTRGDQLRYEALDRNLAMRTELRDRLLKILPTFHRDSGSFGALRDQGGRECPDDRNTLRLRRMDLDALRAEFRLVQGAVKYCNLTRETRTRAYHHTSYLRRLIERREAEARASKNG
jgi:hypothetical protein